MIVTLVSRLWYCHFHHLSAFCLEWPWTLNLLGAARSLFFFNIILFCTLQAKSSNLTWLPLSLSFSLFSLVVWSNIRSPYIFLLKWKVGETGLGDLSRKKDLKKKNIMLCIYGATHTNSGCGCLVFDWIIPYIPWLASMTTFCSWVRDLINSLILILARGFSMFALLLLGNIIHLSCSWSFSGGTQAPEEMTTFGSLDEETTLCVRRQLFDHCCVECTALDWRL